MQAPQQPGCPAAAAPSVLEAGTVVVEAVERMSTKLHHVPLSCFYSENSTSAGHQGGKCQSLPC